MDDFIISGTGQVVRPGDRIIVRNLTFTGNSGPGILLECAPYAGTVAVRFDHSPAEPYFVDATLVMREDDAERVNGQPLWCWC